MSALPVKFINPFFSAVQSICRQTLMIDVSAGKPRLMQPGERLWKLYPISAVIRLDRAVRGIVSLSFSEGAALTLAGCLAQEQFKNLNDDARDALGEVANLIIGSAKRELATDLVTISPPSINKTHHVHIPVNVPTILLPFEAAAGRFLMQLSLASGGSGSATDPALAVAAG